MLGRETKFRKSFRRKTNPNVTYSDFHHKSVASVFGMNSVENGRKLIGIEFYCMMTYSISISEAISTTTKKAPAIETRSQVA